MQGTVDNVPLRGRDVTLTVTSAMVGAGIFLTPGILLQQGAPPWLILSLFVAATIVVIAGAFTLSDLAKRLPGDGGPHRYLSHHVGPWAGFLYNWSRFWVMQCGALAVLSLAAATFLADAMGRHDTYWEAVAALAILAASAAIHTRGLRTSAKIQAVLTVLKVGLILVLAAGILVAADPVKTPPTRLAGGLGSWTLLALFAFGGWTQVTFLAGQTQGDLRRPIAAGILLAAGLYVVALLGMFLSGTVEGRVIAAEAAGNLYGPAARRAVSLVVAIAVLGTLHTQSMTGPRLYAAAAEAGHWWRPFQQRNRNGAPAKATWFQAQWAMLLVAFSLLAANAFAVLISSISTAIWLFHIGLVAAWWLDPGKAIRAGWPILFGAAATFVIVAAVAQDVRFALRGDWHALSATWALLLIASGVPVWAWVRLTQRA